MEFFIEIGKLKNIERSGWLVEGIKNPESVADHSFRTALMALVLAKGREDIDANKAVKMALVHDIAESQIGDVLVDWKIKYLGEKAKRIDGTHGMTQEEKIRIEKNGMEKLVSLLGGDGNEIFGLWKEFEERKSKEAVFVKSVEVFETLLQCFEYEKDQNIEIDWFDHKENWEKIKDAEIKNLALKILEYRKK